MAELFVNLFLKYVVALRCDLFVRHCSVFTAHRNARIASYSNSVGLSVCVSHAGIVSK